MTLDAAKTLKISLSLIYGIFRTLDLEKDSIATVNYNDYDGRKSQQFLPRDLTLLDLCLSALK